MRSLARVLLAGLALAAAGCGGGGAVQTSSSAATGSAAALAPASAPAFISVDTDLSSGQWKAAEHLADAFPGKEKALSRFRAELSKQGVDFDKDVRPALGDELDVVWLDFANGGDNVVGLLKPKDDAKLNALFQKADNPLKRTTVDGWTVFASTQALLDRFRKESGGDKLADDGTFKDALDGLPSDALAKAYVNGAKANEALGSLGGGVGALVPGAGKLAWLGAALEATDDGLKVQGKTKSEGGRGISNYKSKLLPDAPSGALLYVSFHGHKGLFDQLQRNPTIERQLPEVERQLGVTLDELEPLLANEGELYVREGTPIPEVTLAVLVDDEATARSTIDRLLTKVGSLSGTLPRPDTTAGVSGAKELQLGFVTIHAAVFDGKLAITTGSSGISALHDGGAKLTDDPNFMATTAAAGLPNENAGFVYVNLKDSIPLLEGLAQLGKRQLPAELVENLKPLRSVVAYAGSNGGESSFAAFLAIK